MHKPLLYSATRKRLLRWCVLTLLFVMPLARTVIAGDVNGDFASSNENSTVDSYNSSDATTNNYNATGAGSPAPVMSSIAPTVMGAGGNDSCLMPRSSGIQLSMIGISNGGVVQDEACNRRKNARLLGVPQQMGGLGLQVSAISVLCQDPSVFRSMMLANTPCPIANTTTGKLLMGKAAISKYRENPEQYIVGYELDKDFWDALLKVEEDQHETLKALNDTGPKLSLSDRFRSSKRTGRSNADRATKD